MATLLDDDLLVPVMDQDDDADIPTDPNFGLPVEEEEPVVEEEFSDDGDDGTDDE